MREVKNKKEKMELKFQKDLAAQILKCSRKKIIFDPTRLSDIKESITKADIRDLIKKKVIKLKKFKESSKVRARIRKEQKKRGRQKGFGSRKGKKKKGKREWINKIRVQRRLLKSLREEKKINKKSYRNLYLKAKGGFFRSKRHVMLYIEENKLLKKIKNEDNQI